MESKGTADDAGKIDNDPVIAGSSVVREFEVAELEEATVLILK
jgi:hypothetical protein